MASSSLALPAKAKSFSIRTSQGIPIGWIGRNSELQLSQVALINGKCDESVFSSLYKKQDEKSAWLLSIRSLGTGFVEWVLEVKSDSGVGVTCSRTELVVEPDPSPPRIH